MKRVTFNGLTELVLVLAGSGVEMSNRPTAWANGHLTKNGGDCV